MATDERPKRRRCVAPTWWAIVGIFLLLIGSFVAPFTHSWRWAVAMFLSTIGGAAWGFAQGQRGGNDRDRRD